MINSKLQTKKATRKEQALKRKNFLPTLLVTMLLWVLLAALIKFVDPATFGVVPLFFVTVFATLLFTLYLVFANSRRGFLLSLSLSLFSIFMYLGVGNWLNLALILAITLCIELYFSLR